MKLQFTENGKVKRYTFNPQIPQSMARGIEELWDLIDELKAFPPLYAGNKGPHGDAQAICSRCHQPPGIYPHPQPPVPDLALPKENLSSRTTWDMKKLLEVVDGPKSIYGCVSVSLRYMDKAPKPYFDYQCTSSVENEVFETIDLHVEVEKMWELQKDIHNMLKNCQNEMVRRLSAPPPPDNTLYSRLKHMIDDFNSVHQIIHEG